MGDLSELEAAFEAAYAPIRARGVALPEIAQGLETDLRDHMVWVAEANGDICGGVIAAQSGTVGQVVNVAVDPRFFGRGIGRLLIDMAIDALVAGGATEVRLTTHVEMPENVALYTHLGWRETGRAGLKVHMSKRASRRAG